MEWRMKYFSSSLIDYSDLQFTAHIEPLNRIMSHLDFLGLEPSKFFTKRGSHTYQGPREIGL